MSFMNNADDSRSIEKRIQDVYQQYLDIISPLMLDFEVLAREFPTELLNEIRAILTHLARSGCTDDAHTREDNLKKAEGHLKRAILDCFKYMCLAYSVLMEDFEKDYGSYDLTLIDNGEFIPKLNHLRTASEQKQMAARRLELAMESDNDTLYSYYEAAYQSYHEWYQLKIDANEKLLYAKVKSDKNSKMNRRGYYVGIGGLAVGIIGILLAIF